MKVDETTQFKLVVDFAKKVQDSDALLLKALKDRYRAAWVDDIQKSTASSHQKSGAIRVIVDILGNVITLAYMFENSVEVPSTVDTLNGVTVPAWDLAEMYLATKTPINNYRVAKYVALLKSNLDEAVKEILEYDAAYKANITPVLKDDDTIDHYIDGYICIDSLDFDVNHVRN